MPYLNDDFKGEMEKVCDVKKTTDYLSSLKEQDFAGALNYLNFVIVKRYLNKNGRRYWKFALILGTLVCCVFEIYRRLVAGYEDEAIEKNGDVN